MLLVSLAFGHTIESAGAPPAEVDPAIATTLQKDGIRVLDGKKVVVEFWFRSAAPAGAKSTEEALSWPTVPHGSLLGVARFPERGSDRRAQTLKPGVYTMRFSMYPQNGDHQGVEPQRDFMVLSLASEDKDPSSTPKFEALMEMSRRASGTPHPAIMSFWRVESDFKPGIEQRESDTILQAKIGDVPVAVIVLGRNAH